MFDRTVIVPALLRYCLATGASVTSWFRTPKHNLSLSTRGSVPVSPHLRGLAIDVVYDAGKPPANADEVAAGYGLEIVHENDHDHLQPKGWGAGQR